MIQIQGEVRTTIFFFIATMLLLLLLKPELLFSSSGELLQFGLGGQGQGESLVAAPILALLLPVLFYLITRYNKISLF